MRARLAIFATLTLVAAANAETTANERPVRHWAFNAPLRPPLPPIAQPSATLRNPIDAFVLDRLAREGLTASAAADRYTLVRRVSLDLTGLPPSVAEVDVFVNDRSADAYDRLVERLLDSPRHGERWARWWLDVARYADSNGYSIDAPRSIWLYRDWVINALNRDLPFDQFVIHQVAGDMVAARNAEVGTRNGADRAELETRNVELRIATGFHRNTQINEEGGIDKEQFRIESVVDRLATTGTAFLGLTIACAQCHDHKFDPISHEEYYRLFAFFNNQDEPTLELPNPKLDHAALDAEKEKLTVELTRHLDDAADRVAKEAGELSPDGINRLSKPVQTALKQPAADRSFKQRRTIYLALGGNDQEFKAKEARLSELESGRARMISTLVMAERAEPRQTQVHIKGDFTRPGKVVTSGVPAVLHELKVGQASSLSSSAHTIPSGLVNAEASETGRMPALPSRLDFARWLASTDNPLLARVIVNRVWQQYFGKGIVETENDFGTQGLPPSHPGLLDWLAVEFMEGGWSLKQLHRLIVTSGTYRQSSRARAELTAKDPTNKLLARQNRLRLDAELVRDVALSVSGSLAGGLGGPSVHPPQPDGVMSLGQVTREWKADRNEDRFRRGLYTFFYRATPHPALAVFDAPDSFSACSRRPRSNTPLQALTLLNDEGFVEFAQGLATNARSGAALTDDERLARAFRLCVSRPPQMEELAALGRLLAIERQQTPGNTEAEAWTTIARVLLNLDETITRE